MQTNFSTADVAKLLRVPTWRVRRLYEDGTLPEPDRIAGRRVIRGEQLPEIVDGLRRRGWLPETEVETCQ